MFRKKNIATLLALSLASFGVIADQSYIKVEKRLTSEQLHETGLDTLSEQQLERLNQLLREESATHAESEKTRHTDQPGSNIGLEEKTIKSRLVGTIDGWDVDSVFELENGQKWKVLKGSMKLRKQMHAPEVLVVPGVAGRWFLQVDEDMPKARVYRID